MGIFQLGSFQRINTKAFDVMLGDFLDDDKSVNDFE
jgi:hypothetical protein